MDKAAGVQMRSDERRFRRGARCRPEGRSAGRRRDRARRFGDRLRRKPAARNARPLRSRRNARDPPRMRDARRRAPHRMRSLRDAGTLHHVRGRHLVRAHPPGLFRRARSRRAARSRMASASSRSPPAITRRRSMAASARARRRPCCARSSRSADKPQADRNVLSASNVAPGFSSATKWPDDTPIPVIFGAKVWRHTSSGDMASPLVPRTR